MLKKSSFLLASYNNLQSCSPQNGLPFLSVPSPLSSQQKPSPKKHHLRAYATTHSDIKGSGDDLPWPAVSLPSPYQIFHLSPRDDYSKHRFYALVKIYHPDRRHHSHLHSHIHKLPGAIKMERYRLIVAANDILSDPDKRKAYDRTGAGWNGCMEHGLHPSRYDWSKAHGKARWSGFDTNDSPFQNATWEDWERWYNRYEKQKQEPVYTSNATFLSLVVGALVIGAFGQASQVSWHNDLFMQKIEKQHHDATKTMQKHRQGSRRASDMDSRLHEFFRHRDMGAPVALAPNRDERGERAMLPEPVVCMSGTQRGRDGTDKESSDDR